MEILLWLVPAVVVTVAAMAWVSWVGRDGRGEVDRDVAVERLGKALAKELPAGTRRTAAPARDRSTGIAVRPSHGSAATSDGTRRAS
ncbi:hypothetical protein [Nocardioides sp.]|uniref:hypothetical protein n=1 Tax=Nocardioides sp. TaxID=35761 RepID=UPI00261567E3|nr:hypothetical protein [Nocardioides sp.]MCW2739312.1 hypothetical protein [Nocardioides sp.]